MSQDSLLLAYKKQSGREICLRLRDLKSVVNAVLFFLMIIVFFPLTIPANSSLLHMFAPGIIWVGLIFATFLSSEHLFSQDYADGVIEQWLVSTTPITLIVVAKLSIHFLLLAGSVVIISPVLALLLNLSLYQVSIITLSVIFALPAIVTLCALAESFAVGIKQKSLIMGLIILPLNIPILIVGSALTRAVIVHEPISAMLAILLAISSIAGVLLPFAIAGVIRICLI